MTAEGPAHKTQRNISCMPPIYPFIRLTPFFILPLPHNLHLPTITSPSRTPQTPHSQKPSKPHGPSQHPNSPPLHSPLPRLPIRAIIQHNNPPIIPLI